jgi:hypothetical protein
MGKPSRPAGPPRPEFFPLSLLDCGSRTGVGNLAGGNVWITATGAEVGRRDGCANPQGLNPSYSTGQHVRGWFELCGDRASAHGALDRFGGLASSAV